MSKPLAEMTDEELVGAVQEGVSAQWDQTERLIAAIERLTEKIQILLDKDNL